MKLLFPILLLVWWASPADIQRTLQRPFEQWTEEQAVELLNDSPWAKQATFTRLIEGVGSGVRGEKEILSTYYVRLLSAKPVRQALARLEQIKRGYEKMDDRDKASFDEMIRPGLELDMSRWMVVSVNFRSNDPERENRLARFFETETTESLRNNAFLATAKVSQVRLAAYHPPAGDGLGARFVFPRTVDGQEIVSGPQDTLVFELDLPRGESALIVNFPLAAMHLEGELVL